MIVAGGRLHGEDRVVLGPLAIDFLGSFKVEFAVIGASALDAEGSLLDFDIDEIDGARSAGQGRKPWPQCRRDLHYQPTRNIRRVGPCDRHVVWRRLPVVFQRLLTAKMRFLDSDGARLTQMIQYLLAGREQFARCGIR